jgi:hypothetical protein
MIENKKAFVQKFEILCDRFGKNFGAPTIQQYYKTLSARMDDQELEAAVDELFLSAEFFPTPQQIIDAGKASRPPELYQLPWGEEKAYADMTPQEQANYRAAIKRTRSLFSPSGLSAIGNLVQQVEPQTPELKLTRDLQTRRGWLSDPVLRPEAIEWAAAHQEAIELVYDQEGYITDMRLKAASPALEEAIAF